MRGDRGFTLDEVLPAFRDASGWYLSTFEAVDPARWGQPGLGEWSVLELAAHASRAYLTIERYLCPSGQIDCNSGAEYFRRARRASDANQAIAARGRDEVAELGEDPISAVRDRAASAIAAVESASPGAVCVTAVGSLSLADYLGTRVVELTVHTLDMAAAMQQTTAEPPGSAARVSLIVLAAMAATPSSSVLLWALTGRATLP
ncbi:MAG: maleylpyruvate isomerase N-terminal domain-containing protein, partial [Acidimicrobiales bacterium]